MGTLAAGLEESESVSSVSSSCRLAGAAPFDPFGGIYVAVIPTNNIPIKIHRLSMGGKRRKGCASMYDHGTGTGRYRYRYEVGNRKNDAKGKTGSIHLQPTPSSINGCHKWWPLLDAW
jgi:hypothetical protein